jgi:hypothetical protein
MRDSDEVTRRGKKFGDWVKAGRKTLVAQCANNLTAELGQVEAAEALSVCRSMGIRATKSRLDEVVGKAVLRLDEIFEIAGKVMNDHTWILAASVIALLHLDYQR